MNLLDRVTVNPARCEQERSWLVTGLPRPSDDLGPLGDEQSMLGLQTAPQVDVAQLDVVGQSLVG